MKIFKSFDGSFVEYIIEFDFAAKHLKNLIEY